MVPEELKYTPEHEWIASTGDDTVRIGITDHAQNQLGDVVFVDLPTVGTQMSAGGAFGEVESTKSVSEVFAPLAGEIVGRNDALESSPELVNSDPYGQGWLVEIRLSDPAKLDELLDAAGYRSLIDQAE